MTLWNCLFGWGHCKISLVSNINHSLIITLTLAPAGYVQALNNLSLISFHYWLRLSFYFYFFILDSWAFIAASLIGFSITGLTEGSLSNTGIVTLGLVLVSMHWKIMIINKTDKQRERPYLKNKGDNHISPGMILLLLYYLGEILLSMSRLN